MLTHLQQAIHNNARWCETICAAHGIPGEFSEDLWLNRHQVPRFYPNAVTLTTERGILRQFAAIRDLVATAEPGTISVKDSFNSMFHLIRQRVAYRCGVLCCAMHCARFHVIDWGHMPKAW